MFKSLDSSISLLNIELMSWQLRKCTQFLAWKARSSVMMCLCGYVLTARLLLILLFTLFKKKNVADIRFEYELITLPKLTCMCKGKPENLCTGNKEDKDEELGLVFVKVLFVKSCHCNTYTSLYLYILTNWRKNYL